MQKGDILTLDIEKLSNLGFGIAKDGGFVVFVENSVPGDKVRAKITKVNKNLQMQKSWKFLSHLSIE